MDVSIVAAVGAVLVAFVSAYFTYRSSAQANRTADRKVDSEAYERAKAIWQGAIDQSEKDIERLRRQVERLESTVRTQAEMESSLRQQIQELKATVARMERQNRRLRVMLRTAGIDVPENGDDQEGESVAI